MENSAISLSANLNSNGFSRLLGWEVTNFMSFDHGKVDFDDTNIINIKGYNNSGKSAMLRALDILFYNIKPSMQTSFIKHGADYFRIQAYFSDGIIILRDKYINGQSLYEMYKYSTEDDGSIDFNSTPQLIFTTKKNGKLTKVADVPEPIQHYLGLITYDDMNLNSRSCFEKQFLVQTTGSENYKSLNAVLKSEELALANETLNVDKNKVAADISACQQKIDAYEETYKDSIGLTEELLTELHKIDKSIDASTDKVNTITSIESASDDCAHIVIAPEIPVVDVSSLVDITNIINVYNENASLVIPPEVGVCDVTRLNEILGVSNIKSELDKIGDVQSLTDIDITQVSDLQGIVSLLGQLKDVSDELNLMETQLKALNDEGVQLSADVAEFGTRYVRCKNCGALVEVGKEHDD